MITIICVVKDGKLHCTKWVDGVGGSGKIIPWKEEGPNVSDIPQAMDN